MHVAINKPRGGGGSALHGIRNTRDERYCTHRAGEYVTPSTEREKERGEEKRRKERERERERKEIHACGIGNGKYGTDE